MNRPILVDGRTVWKRDDGAGNLVTVTGSDDYSPTYLHYDPRCAACWLNWPHSTDEHNRNVARNPLPKWREEA